LNVYLGRFGRYVFEARDALGKEDRNLVQRTGVRHDEQFILIEAHRDQIVDNPAVVIEQKTVPGAACFDGGNVADNKRFIRRDSLLSLDRKLAHVGTVKDRGFRAGVFVLAEDTRVLNRQCPAAEIYNLAPVCLVLIQ
jgi:hypothetical protein